MGMKAASRELFRILPPPVDLYVVAGHGRSLKHWTSIGYRSLPGVLECGLWDALDSAPPVEGRSAGLITDIGNDLLYGHSADDLMRWLTEVVTRTRPHVDELVLTHMPTFSFDRLTPLAYQTFSRFFMPNVKPRPYEKMRSDLTYVSEAIDELAASVGAVTVKPEPEWYGVDPIHLRLTKKREAWRAYVESFATGEEVGEERSGVSILFARPAEMRVLGRVVRTKQPIHHDKSVKLNLY
ncbi:hypothetical protein V22_10020 [Calycomorphotria hydatis]|uniref:SGNH hydrolase-type esterase domain-containing protein n=2 Tax=Calycomorphotria hydatis TaxID=2528027 RepID=A0A517T5X3_9PLAN|nr:hypothetical protein V22_10020 [Calycomorphotria hydatis]